MLVISPTAIALAGLKQPPATGTDGPATRCMACGISIEDGAPRLAWKPNQGSFTDWQYLDNHSGVCCPHCIPFLENKLLTATQRCVIGIDGAWSLSKDAHRAWFLRTPPEPPFVAVISDSMKQHLLWRAAVTVDRDLLRIQIGRSGLMIDRPLLFDAVHWAGEAAEIARAGGLRVNTRHPFAALDRERSSPAHAVLRGDIVRLATDTPRLRTLLDHLLTLGEGELWGLSILAKQKEETPLQEPLSLHKTPPITEEEEHNHDVVA